ncbi:4Fe-4S dicluster domain-containing protein [Methanobrevibacter filiformis]|uniref:Iron-sulfur protein n=1 Tax=Methanobrevibacter filiformis TaxID=55758 RepID=A0A165Z100_9EURY|nr:4Fe-4S dicluster domain-containing protein [Methanobrevibacter filiformis]KZX10111.1 iron-sulfur protein [Methanobrevibacter filiformis]
MEKIVVQQDLCDGCLDCEQACFGLHGSSRINIREVEDSYYPILCQQCADAPCVTICPTESMEQDGVDSDKCIACGLCMMVCPFGAVKIENKIAQKCNRCRDREDGPACIKACSKRAISLLDIDQLKIKKQNEFLEKMAGINKKPKSNSFINLITSNTRANRKD